MSAAHRAFVIAAPPGKNRCGRRHRERSRGFRWCHLARRCFQLAMRRPLVCCRSPQCQRLRSLRPTPSHRRYRSLSCQPKRKCRPTLRHHPASPMPRTTNRSQQRRQSRDRRPARFSLDHYLFRARTLQPARSSAPHIGESAVYTGGRRPTSETPIRAASGVPAQRRWLLPNARLLGEPPLAALLLPALAQPL